MSDEKVADPIDHALRPPNFDDFIGQDLIKSNLSIAIKAAKQRGEILDHVLFAGLPGLGKTTLSCIIAAEMGAKLECVSGPAVEKAADIAGVLTRVNRGDILFIDEIHRLDRKIEEFIYTAMEDFRIDIITGQGASAKTFSINLEPFTLVGATTREDLLTNAFRGRFGIKETLEPYSLEESIQIAFRSARLLDIELKIKGAHRIAKASRGTPRKINTFVRRLRDLAQIHNNGVIDEETAVKGLLRQGIDENGLEREEKKILELLAKKNKPLGLKTIARTLNSTEQTVEQIHEQYLLAQGYITITTSGRAITREGREVLGKRKDVLF